MRLLAEDAKPARSRRSVNAAGVITAENSSNSPKTLSNDGSSSRKQCCEVCETRSMDHVGQALL